MRSRRDFVLARDGQPRERIEDELRSAEQPKVKPKREPARRARTRRQAVGLSDTPGLLVTDVTVGSAAADAGIERGDLIIAIDGVPTISSVGLALLLDDLTGCPAATVTLLRGNDQVVAELRIAPPH